MLHATSNVTQKTVIVIETDKPRNLLTFNYCGKVDAEQVKNSLEPLRTAIAGMRPDFALVTDLSGLESMETGSMRYIRQAMDLLNKSGVAKVLRVIPDPSKDIGLNILSVFHYRRGLPIITCDTLDDAMEMV